MGFQSAIRPGRQTNARPGINGCRHSDSLALGCRLETIEDGVNLRPFDSREFVISSYMYGLCLSFEVKWHNGPFALPIVVYMSMYSGIIRFKTTNNRLK